MLWRTIPIGALWRATSCVWGRAMGIKVSDAAYYRMREEQELGRADEATLTEVRTIHLKLAEKYRALAIKANLQMSDGIADVSFNGSLSSKSI